LDVVAAQLKVAPSLSALDTSAPGPSAPDTYAPDPSAPSLIDQRRKGVVEATTSEDKDTCSGFIFKRKQKAKVAVLVPSGSDDRAPTYKEHPPNASSPRDLVVQEGRGESALGGDRGAPPTGLPAFLQRALQSFQN